MITTPDDTATYRRYLLGEATEAEAEALERSYLDRDEVLEAIGAVEQDLIDEYLDGQLDPRQRRRFEAHYLASPVHRERLAIASGLRGRGIPWRRRMPLLPIAAVAAALVVALLGTWLLRSRPSWERVVALTLPAVQVRGEGETPTARVGEDTIGVELRLETGDWNAASPYRVSVTTTDGEEVWRGDAVVSSREREGGPRGIVVATVPADRLPAGDYVVVLSAGATDAVGLQRSYFRVVPR